MKNVVAVVAMLGLASGCGIAIGDGNVVTRERTLEGITEVVNDSQLEIVVEPGSGPARLTIDENLHDEIWTTVSDGVLRVTESDGLLAARTARLVVYSEDLQRLRSSGAGSIRAAGFAPRDTMVLEIDGLGSLFYEGQPEQLTIKVSGAGNAHVKAAGDFIARSVRIAASGAGNVDATELPAENLDVTSDGLGEVDARIAGGHLRVHVDGAGDVTWYGAASSQDIEDSGLGRVIHVP